MIYIDFHTHHPTAEGVISPRSFGIHPWDCEHWKQENATRQRNGMTEVFPSGIQLVGECGLDKCCEVGWATQMEFFDLQLQYAEEHGLPVVVHCVRAFNELIGLRKRHPHTPWVVHGFIGSVEMADQLAMFGIGVSFGAAILDPRRAKVHDALRSRLVDKNKLRPLTFLETDDSNTPIQEVYDGAAQILGIDKESLADAIKHNYSTLF